MAIIEAEGLVKVYKSRRSEVRALDGVDLGREPHRRREPVAVRAPLVTLGWYVVLQAVFAPLAVRRYRSISR